MDREELKKYSTFNEENLNLIQKIKLQALSKKENSDALIKIANISFEHLDTAERVYIAKYLTDRYSFYESSNDRIYIAPQNASSSTLKDFYINEDVEEVKRNQLYSDMGLGVRDVKIYSILPGVKYKLIRHERMTGYASIDQPWNLLNQKINIKDTNLLDFYRNSRRFLGPKKCKYAYVCYDQKVTWEQFEEMVEKYIKSLTACDIKLNDVVPVCITSSVEAIALYFAIDTIGATTFFIDPVETNTAQINKYLKMFNAKIVFADSKNLSKIEDSTMDTDINRIIVMAPTDSMDPNDPALSEYSREYIKNNTLAFNETDSVMSLNNFIRIGKEYSGSINYCTDNSHLSLITSTSASTGEPKLVELSRHNIMCELEQIKRTTNIQLGPNGINMQVVPFKYPYGFVVSTLISPYVGKTGGLTPDFALENYHKFILMYHPTYIHLIPSLMMHMQNNPYLQNEDLSYLQFVVSGGDKFETTKKEKANEWLKTHNSSAKLKDASGAAEVTAGQTASTVGKYNIESVGKPMIGTIVKVVDDNGNEVPYGVVGKLMYAGENIMQGYVNSDKTDEVRIVDESGRLWIKTDSYGFIDNEGFVYMCGRERDFYITYPKGKPPFKVYNAYVEAVINSVEEIHDFVVVKQSNDEMFYAPKAYVVIKNFIPREKYAEVIEKVRLVCEHNLDACAVPISFEIVPELKVKPSQKVDRNYYVELAEEEYQSNHIEAGKKL